MVYENCKIQIRRQIYHFLWHLKLSASGDSVPKPRYRLALHLSRLWLLCSPKFSLKQDLRYTRMNAGTTPSIEVCIEIGITGILGGCGGLRSTNWKQWNPKSDGKPLFFQPNVTIHWRFLPTWTFHRNSTEKLTFKAFSFRGGVRPLTRASVPGSHWGLRPLTPFTGSRSTVAICGFRAVQNSDFGFRYSQSV